MTKTTKIIRIVLFTILFIGIVGYIAFYVVKLSSVDPDSECTGVELILDTNGADTYITGADVDNILNKAHLTPTGKKLTEINLRQIESFVASNPFVKDANCYKSPSRKVVVKIEQRQPLVFIIPEGHKGYYLDVDGSIVENTRYVSNVILASGSIDERYAKNELFQFAQFLSKDEFWDNQIEQIYVLRDKKNNRVVELVPRVGDHIIYLGTIKDFEKKLRRMRLFYKKAVGTVGWKKYSRFNLEYENQIICTKHKK